MSQSTAEQHAAQPFEHNEQIGTVELDRYCSSCGYNLRQQAVRREPTTRLLLCKCPECGAFEPANTLTTATRGWFRGLVVFAWLFWLLLWLKLVGWSVFGVTGLAVVSGDLRRDWVEMDQVDQSQLVANDALRDYYQSMNNTVMSGHGYYTSNAWELGPMRDEDMLVIGLFLVLAGAIGVVMTAITTITMPHWPRWGYVAFACGWPLIGIFVFHGMIWRELYGWRLVTADLMNWHLGSAVSIEAVAIVGGLLAVWLGRPIARGVIRVIVPPRRRGAFAYLWLVDGKTAPNTVEA